MSLKGKLLIAFLASMGLVVVLMLVLWKSPVEQPVEEEEASPVAAATEEGGPAAPREAATPRPRAQQAKKLEPGAKSRSIAGASRVPVEGGWDIAGRIVRDPAAEAAGDTSEVPVSASQLVPVAGAAVVLKPHPRRSRPEDAFPPEKHLTGPDGRFEFKGVPARINLRIEIDSAGLAGRALSFRFSEPDTETRKDAGDVIIEPGTDLTVHVFGPRGEPVEKGMLLMNKTSAHRARSQDLSSLGFNESRREAVEQGKGVYRFEGVPTGPMYVEATAPGYAPSDRNNVTLPSEEPLVVKLLEGTRLAGVVLSTEGKPIEGVEMEADGPGDPQKAKSDAEGRFLFDALREGDYNVTAVADGYVTERRSGISTGVEDLQFSLAPEAVFSGKVVSEPDSAPVPKAKITLRSTGDRGGASFTADADAKGEFKLRKLPEGAYVVLADHPDYAPSLEEAREIKAAEKIDGQVIQLARGFSALGKVLEATGKAPVADAQVTFQLREPGKPGVARRTAKTGPDGTFEAKGLKEGNYSLSASARGYFTAKSQMVAVTAQDTKDLTVLLEPGSSIAGQVTDAAGSPISGVTVRPNVTMSPGGNWSESLNSVFNITTRTDAEGKYRLEGLPPHSGYIVMATHRDFAQANAKGIELGPRESVEGIDIRMSRGGSIRGRVVDDRGKPISGSDVSARPETNNDEEERAYFNQGSPNVTSDAEGNFVLPHLAAGSYRVGARVRNLMPASRSQVQVTEERETGGIELVLGIGEVLAGRVVDSDGQPLSGVDLRIYDESQAQGRTDAEGKFEMKGLQTGQVHLSVSKSGYQGVNRQITVPSKEKDLVIALERGARISGIVRAAGKDSFSGFQIMAVTVGPDGRAMNSSGSYENDPTGRFDMQVSKGTLYLVVTVPGFAPTKSAQFTVGAGERIEDVVIDLKAGGIVQGTVVAAATGKPVGGANVSAMPQVQDPMSMGFGAPSVSTAGDGTFTLEGVPEGVVTVVASHAQFAQASVPGLSIRSGETTPARLELTAGGSIRGTVARGGQALARAQVQVWKNDNLGQYVGKNATTDAQGRFEIKGLPAGEYSIMVRTGSRRQSAFNQQSVVVADGQVSEINLSDEAAVRLSGRVLSGGGPVRGGNISAFQAEKGFGGTSSEIDASGSYSLDLPGPGVYSLMVNLPGGNGRGAKVDVTIPEGESQLSYDVELPMGEIAGIVVDAETGAPIANAQVGAFGPGTARSMAALFRSMSGMTMTDDLGQFSVANLAPATYSVRAFVRGYAGGRAENIAIDEDGAAGGIRIALERGLSVRARVVDAKGLPVAQAMAIARDSSGDIMLFNEPSMSGPDGVLEHGGLSAGTYRLTIVHRSYGPVTFTAKAAAGGAEQTVVLRPGGKVVLQVASTRSKAVDGAEVDLVNEAGENVAEDLMFMGGGAMRAIVTSRAGTLTLEPIAAGSYRLVARKGNARSREERITVIEGQTVERQLVIEE